MEKLTLLIFFLLISFSISYSQSNSQENGFLILNVGNSASMTGKGEAASATSSDATVLWYNPAAVQINQYSNFCFSHNSYIKEFDINIENASLIIKKGNYSYGLGVVYLNYGKLDKTDEVGTIIGEYHPIDIVIAGNYAMRISPYFSFGTNLKIVYEKIDTESSLGFGTDLGVIYDSFIKGLNLAFVLQNIGFSTKMDNERIEFPLTYKIGVHHELNLFEQSELSVSCDLIKFEDEDVKLNLGLEYAFAEVIYTRLGYKIGYDVENFSGGLGIKLNNYRFDYSFTPFQSGLGNAHRFSISYDF
ncbi:MAG: PorV/PorQ family protein [Candidatus Cloacimonetes bacterium]|nr:PorV/PorQ family protein [Candidatus Cloacimonadota bacterium]